ncbi:hypothetical protein TrVGV298_006171 [Trichoderma virens]|nr:hypothetical protein TrVGV298_006171 [Trichoderma virens]
MATNSTLGMDSEYLAESKTHVVTVMYAIPIALEAFSTGWRLWASATGPSGLGFAFDDYLMLFATLVAMVVCATGLVYGPPHGLGRHIEAVPEHDVQLFLKGDYIFSHFYDLAIAFTKLSILALYHRIFVTRKFRLIIIGTACFVCAWVAVMEVVLGFGCRPIQAWWGEAEGKCINKEAFTYFTNVTNMVTDMWVFMMPIPVILGLQTAREKKGTRPVWEFYRLGNPAAPFYAQISPQIFRHLVIIRDMLIAGVQSATNSGSAATAVSADRLGGYKGSLQHPDWAKLSHSDGLMGETSGTVTEVSAQKPPDAVIESDELRPGCIMVQRELLQTSEPDIEAAPVREVHVEETKE